MLHLKIQLITRGKIWHQYKNNKLKNNSPIVQWRVWITRCFLFCVKYSRLYQIYRKKHETLTTNFPIHVYINRINNRLVSKTKDECKLELQTTEMINFFGSTKKLIDKMKNGENLRSIEIVEVVLVQYSLVDN